MLTKEGGRREEGGRRKDDDGETALNWAVKKGHGECAEILRQAGAH